MVTCRLGRLGRHFDLTAKLTTRHVACVDKIMQAAGTTTSGVSVELRENSTRYAQLTRAQESASIAKEALNMCSLRYKDIHSEQ